MTPSRRNRGWIWFFVVLAGLTLLATVTLGVYNWTQQLRPEQLEAAQRLWEEKGPRDYQLLYTTRISTSAEPDRFLVRVRRGEVEYLAQNNIPKEKRLYSYYGMSALFDQIQQFLEKDRQPDQPRTYTRAIFDPDDGHVCWYVRRVMGSTERVEITVEELRPLSGEEAARP